MPQESVFYCNPISGELFPKLGYSTMPEHEPIEPVSAFLASEIGEMLPQGIRNSMRAEGNDNSPNALEYDGTLFRADTEADARAKLLIHLIESEIVKPSEL